MSIPFLIDVDDGSDNEKENDNATEMSSDPEGNKCELSVSLHKWMNEKANITSSEQAQALAQTHTQTIATESTAFSSFVASQSLRPMYDSSSITSLLKPTSTKVTLPPEDPEEFSSSSFVHVFNIIEHVAPTVVNRLDNFSMESISNIKPLSSGAHSGVYGAIFQTQPVVLKLLTEESRYNVIARKDFDAEIMILSRLNHQHIVSMIGFTFLEFDSPRSNSKVSRSSQATDPNFLRRPLIILEPLNGSTLTYHLKLRRSFHSRPFSELRYIRMSKEMASALDYLHYQFHPECTILHRDLKPDNIGFTSDGTLKLLDFGLSICVRRSTSLQGAYDLSGCTGSFRYMAPENASNKYYNEKVDMYSFGLILYEIITGVTPFSGFNKKQLYDKVINGSERPGLDYDDYGREVKMHTTLQRIITSCWDGDPMNRMTATEVLTLLTRLEEVKLEEHRSKNILSRSLDLLKKKDSI